MIAVVKVACARLMRSPLARRFLGGAAWSVLGSALSSGITIIMLMLLARVLGKDVYGRFVVIQSTLGMVGVFAGFGIGAAATRYAAELKTRDTIRLGHILALAERGIVGFGLAASATLVFSAGWIASHILNAPDLSLPLAISACAVLFSALDSYQKSVLIGFESMRAFATGTVIGAIAGLPIMLLAANNFGLQGAAVATLLNALLQASFSRYQMVRELNKNNVPRCSKGCLNERPILWRFAFPALLSGALVAPAHWATQAFLANTSNGYAELAVLGIAMQWFNVIMFIPSTAGRVVLPMLTDLLMKNNHGGSRKFLIFAIAANAIVALPVAVIVSIFSPKIMGMYGNNFQHDYLPLTLAVMTAAILAIQAPVGNMLAASSRMWLGALMNAGWASVYVSVAYLLVNKGAVGVTLALGIGYIIHTIWVGCFTVKALGKNEK
jgi:O-antigen/teichoic acid export membrane protein